MHQQVGRPAIIAVIIIGVAVIGGVFYFTFTQNSTPRSNQTIPIPAAAQHMSRPLIQQRGGKAPGVTTGVMGAGFENTAPVDAGAPAGTQSPAGMGVHGPSFQNTAPVGK